MRDETAAQNDSQWDFALEIASKLWFQGECVFIVKSHPLQHLVNVRWAALQAGRLLGVHTKVAVAELGNRASPIVTATVTFEDPDGHGRARAQEGLEALLRSARAHQGVAALPQSPDPERTRAALSHPDALRSNDVPDMQQGAR